MEHLLRDNHSARIVVGMERERRHIAQIGIEEQMDVMLRIVHQSERRHRAGAQAQITLHTLLRSERELALMQAMLQIVDGQRLLAVEDHQIVAVALMVAEKEVFTVLRAILAPIFAGNLDGRSLGMVVNAVLYVVRSQKIIHLLATQFILFTHNFGWIKKLFRGYAQHSLTIFRPLILRTQGLLDDVAHGALTTIKLRHVTRSLDNL